MLGRNMLRQIFCFEDQAAFNRWIKENPARQNAPVVSLNNPCLDISADDRRIFMRAYVDLVGSLSAVNNSLLWWATDLSSKNRFFSPLVTFLEKFYKLLRIIQRADADILCVIDVPFILMPSLKAALKERPVQCAWQGFKLRYYVLLFREILQRYGRVLRHLGYILPRILKAKQLFGDGLAECLARRKPVCLIKTFMSQKSFDQQGAYKDLFFGILPDFLAQTQPMIILGDTMDDINITWPLVKRNAEGKIYPLEAFMSVKDVLYRSAQMLGYRMFVPKRLDFNGTDVSGILKGIVDTFGNKIQPLHLYQHDMMLNVLAHYDIKQFILTCEFNPWEKMCIMALRQASPQTKIIGYQHTVVPQASVNMFTSRFEENIIPRPDLLLTVGKKPEAIIHRYETCVSSNVKPACGLRFAYLFSQPQAKREKRGNVLLALEGLPQVSQMVNYVLNHWGNDCPYQLRVRTHPVLPVERFAGQLVHDPRKMPKVTISEGTSLKEDLLWADIVIYWGTTVSLEAISMGKPVIHFDTGSMLSYDPLFELDQFKWVAGESSDLLGLIDSIYALSDEAYRLQCAEAKAYIADYFHPITAQTMNYFNG